MADQPASPDLWKLIEQWVVARLGVKGTIALAILTALAALWWNWEKIAKLPGMAWLLRRFARRPPPLPSLPKPAPGRFAVAVAHLANDPNGEQEQLIVAALEEMRTIQVLRFDRLIAPQGDIVDEVVQAGHEQARALLGESGADVLIWGMVLRSGQQAVPKLRWTTSGRLPVENRSGRYPATGNLELPELFHKDLTDILDLLVLRSRDYIDPDQAYTRTPMPEFIERVDHLLSAESTAWPSGTRARLLWAFADLCLVYGIKDWKNDEWLRKAQNAYLAGMPKEGEGWLAQGNIAARFNLAQTYFLRGSALHDRHQLEEAIPLYRTVATWTEGWDRRYYLNANLLLGHSLMALGKEESGTARLEQAVAAYGAAMSVADPARDLDSYRSMLWGSAECLRMIGERETGIARLEQAAAAYQELLPLYDAGSADLRKQTEEALERVHGEIRARTPDA